MNGKHLDSLARSMCRGCNRRQMLKGLFGGGVAIATTASLRNPASAQLSSNQPEGASCDPTLLVPCADGRYCCAPGTGIGICMPEASCTPDLPCDRYGDCPGRTNCCEGTCSGFDETCPVPADDDDDDSGPTADDDDDDNGSTPPAASDDNGESNPPEDAAPINTLPDTGSGPAVHDAIGRLGATLAASAAAVAAARALRSPRTERDRP